MDANPRIMAGIQATTTAGIPVETDPVPRNFLFTAIRTHQMAQAPPIPTSVSPSPLLSLVGGFNMALPPQVVPTAVEPSVPLPRATEQAEMETRPRPTDRTSIFSYTALPITSYITLM